jgi:hypothetical protein
MATISPAGSSLKNIFAPPGFTPCGQDSLNGSVVRSTIPYSLPLGLRFANGRYRIRTCVTEVTDLQSVPFNHSGNLPDTSPENSTRYARLSSTPSFYWLMVPCRAAHAPCKKPLQQKPRASGGTRTPDRLITNQQLYQLSYAGPAIAYKFSGTA